jgi:hypothetical protein
MVRIMTESVWLGSWNVNRFNAAGVLAKYTIFSRTIARGKTLAPPKAILMNTA